MTVGAAWLCSINNSYNEGGDEGKKKTGRGRKMVVSTT